MIWAARIGLIALLAFGNAQIALACGVCFEKSEETVSDRLLSADAVVIAREDRDQPYKFAPVTFLLGAAHDAPIPFLVDSSTKRRLERHPADGVLMVREGIEWTRAGYANAAWQNTAAKILENGTRWQSDPRARFAFFEGLLHGADPFLRHLATDELSRASYDLIRGMAQPITGEVARQSLIDRNKIPWQSFYILMLGLSDRDEDHAFVRERTATAARVGSSNQLEAWATALVEVDGAAGVRQLSADWLENQDSDMEDLRAVIMALSTHGQFGDHTLRAVVLAVFSELAKWRPEVVGTVATAFGRMGDFSQVDTIKAAVQNLLKDGMRSIEASELFAASSYVYSSSHPEMVRFDRFGDF